MVVGDEDISTTDITIPPILIQGPITRSRAHQLKQQVNSFLCSSSCENENRLLPNDVLVLRNLGEDQQGLGKGRGVGGAARTSTSRGSPSPTRLRLHLGIQEQAEPKLMPRTHTDSVLDVLYMDGKRIS